MAFVWPVNGEFDSPRQGYHVTPGDAGGGTFGGVIEATWSGAVKRGLVTGTLAHATTAQLAIVLRDACWGPACDALPSGVDLMLFNGRMMSGRFPCLFQQCVGLAGEDVDGDIGPQTLAMVASVHPPTLIGALFGVHAAYLRGLTSWARFGTGWDRRLTAARTAALAMAKGTDT